MGQETENHKGFSPSTTYRLPAAACGRYVFSRNYGQAERAIRTSKLNPLPDLHLWPIYVVVFDGPSKGSRWLAKPPFTLGRSDLGACFTLRCFQRLSLPDFATQPCHGRDSWDTRGLFIPVLSY